MKFSERDEMTPSIDAAKKLASLLDTTVGYLLGETDDHDLFKDPEMLKRFKELHSIDAKEREHILFAIDSMLKNIASLLVLFLPYTCHTFAKTALIRLKT